MSVEAKKQMIRYKILWTLGVSLLAEANKGTSDAMSVTASGWADPGSSLAR